MTALRPEALRPEGLRPEERCPEALPPEALRPEALRSSALPPEGLRPEALRPEGLRPEGLRSSGLPTEGLRPEALRPEALPPEGRRPEGLRPEALRSSALPPEGRRPEALRPEGLRPEALRPEGLRPEALRPEALRSSALPPEALRPEGLEHLVRSRLLAGDFAGAPLRTRIRRIAAEEAALPLQILDDTVDTIAASLTGLGPLEGLLCDPDVSEVMVNGPGAVYVERNGRIERANVRFASDDAVLAMIERVIGPLGLRIDEASPMVDARLPDGSRFHAIIPPLVLGGPTCNIRRFVLRAASFDELSAGGFASPASMEFLARAVSGRRCILVSGGTSSGKTTFLNVLSSAIPDHERIITIEDAAELQLDQPHVVSLESRSPNSEGHGEVSVRALVRNALRMRPDRIVIGEVRGGGEAVDMLAAMNTGHDGSLGTLHANSPRDALSRLETMVLSVEPAWPLQALRCQIAAALDLIVQLRRLPEGTRRIEEVTEVRRVGDDIDLVTLFLREGDVLVRQNVDCWVMS